MEGGSQATVPMVGRWLDDGRTLALLSATGFSLKAIFIKLAYAGGQVDAITLLALRMGLALPAFIWLASRGQSGQLSSRDWLAVILLGLSGYYLSSLFDFLGLQYISAGLERLILFTYPTLVILMEAGWRRRMPSPRMWAALALCYAGLLAAFGHDIHATGASQVVWIGGGWVFLSSLSYSTYFIGTGRVVKRLGSTRLTGYSGAVASTMVIAHYGLTRPLDSVFHVPTAVYGWALALAAVSTVLPVWLAARAVERLGPGKTAAMGTIGPVLTICFGWIILREPFSWLQVAGLALVVAGVSWVGKSK